MLNVCSVNTAKDLIDHNNKVIVYAVCFWKLRRPELIAVWKIGFVNVLIFAYVILMVFRVYLCEKNTPHCDYSETGAISKYVSNMAFLHEIYRENTTFRSKFRFKKTNSWNFETLLNICMGIIKWYLYGYFLNFSKRQMGGGGVTVKILEEGLSQILKMCQMTGSLI